MIHFKNYSIELLSGKKIIDNLDISIDKGDKVAIIGEEGNGKSSLLRALIKDLTLLHNAKVTGQVLIDSNSIGYLPQFMDEGWNNFTVEDYFIRNCPIDDIDYDKYLTFDKVNEYFSKYNLDFDKLITQQIINLSGGEKIKIELIKLLLGDYDILALDEPTNDLDLSSIEMLENFVNNSTKTILFISHDEQFIRNTANAILLFERVKKKTQFLYTFEHLKYDEFISKRHKLLSKQNQMAVNEHKRDKARQNTLNEIKNKVEIALINCPRGAPQVGANLKQKMKAVMSTDRRYQRERENMTQKPDTEESSVIKFQDAVDRRNIIFNYQDKLKVNSKEIDVNFFVKAKDKIGIIGDNGVGKTTFINYLVDILKGNGYKVGVMPQNYESYLSNFRNVQDFIMSQSYNKETMTKIITMLSSLKFTNDELQLDIRNLSGGQKTKIILCCFMASQSEILVLDEPTRNLSPMTNPALREALTKYNGTLITVSHDRTFIKQVCDKVYRLYEDKLILINNF